MTDEVLDDRGMSEALAARLERIAREVAAEWGLSLGPRMEAGRYSYVAPAGEAAILKVIPDEDESASQQADALSFWAGDGAVRLLRHDARRRALLLERLVPGTEAAAVGEDEAIAAAVAVGRRIWRPAPSGHRFPTLRDDVARWLPDDAAHPLAASARVAYAKIAPRVDTVLHADLHHHNILRRGEEWVAIDPKPLVGEPEYDIPPFLWNPLEGASTRERTERRIRAFADAGLDGDRIRTWAIVRGVMLGMPSRPWRPIVHDRAPFRVVRHLL
ncbi:MAG TPA: aminoglycoside phosphotransferase family protein [bacterium]|nr:aminoglycoside phosphotransferase family protein [bacterium]